MNLKLNLNRINLLRSQNNAADLALSPEDIHTINQIENALKLINEQQ